MAVTSQNYTMPGVEEIIGRSALAINNFSQSALIGEGVLIQLQKDAEALKNREEKLLAYFGGIEGLKQRIAQFKADAQNFAGRGLRLNFTLPFDIARDEQLQKAQDDFNIYIVNYLQQYLGKDVVDNLDVQRLFQYLNLEDMGLSNLITVMVSEKGATVKGFKHKSGGQVGSKTDERKLGELMLKDASSAVVARISLAVKQIKKDLQKQGVDIEAYSKIEQNRVQIYSGTKWANLTSRGGAPLKESEAKNNAYICKHLDEINRQIVGELRGQLGFSGAASKAFDAVINHMLAKNKFMFFVGKNTNQITGLIGEITAMILFYDLIHSFPSVEWAARHTGLSGTQASADIIIHDGYGIQVKHSTTDFGMIENVAQELTIGFSDVSLDRLGDMLHFNSEPIEDLYDAQSYNISYTWGTETARKGSGTFREGSNSNFAGTDAEIDALIQEFELLMTTFSASLLYMDDVRNRGLNVYSGDMGNVLYMVNLIPYRASDMLQKIIDSIEGKGANPLSFSVDQHKDLVSGTIVDEINPNPHSFFSAAGTESHNLMGPRRPHSRYLKTSYTFTYN